VVIANGLTAAMEVSMVDLFGFKRFEEVSEDDLICVHEN